jgi:DNA repair protein RadA/Sms
MGKCTECGAFGTVEEKAIETTAPSIVGVKSKGTSTMSSPALRMQDISAESHRHKSTGIGEFDRVLGGGLIKGGVILLAGEPGVGKSSLLALVAHHISLGSNVLYVSGEESVQQIKIRHQRMKAEGEQLYLASENDLSKVIWHIDEIKPELIIVDSVQTIASPDIDGRAGSPSQVTEVATILTRIAKERGIPLIFVGHFTKAGDVAGPRVVEHLVDVVLSFEGESDSPLRLLRGIKNRFGPADEIGCFEHTEEGLEEVADPSGLLLSSRSEPVMGVATSIFLEGKRALPIEVQALVTASVLPNPRKVTSGLDSPKTIQIQAVMEKHGGLRLSDKDVYVSTIGGMKVKETSIDLATVIALASAQLSLIARNDAVAIGEVALSGEIRRTPGINRKLAEALRLGFNVAFVPVGTKAALTPSLAASSLKVIELKNVEHAVGAVRGFAMAHEMGIDTK